MEQAENLPMKPGDAVRLKTGDSPVMVVEGPVYHSFITVLICDSKSLVCVYFSAYAICRVELPEACLELCEPKTN